MEAMDKKSVDSSTVSSKYGKDVIDAVPKASQPVPQPVERSASGGPISSHPDPTRFGDWERAGRCIDF